MTDAQGIRTSTSRLAFLQQVTAGDSKVDSPFSAQDWNVVGAKKDDVDRQLLDECEERAFLATELQAGLIEELCG